MRRLLSTGQPVHTLHVIPERVGVEHEPGRRHDVGPVARLVLAQQLQTWMLLTLQPCQRSSDARFRRRQRPRSRRDLFELSHRYQPPKRSVDAADIPEVGIVQRLDELWNLTV